MTNRKFYKTMIIVEVLSEERYSPESIEGIARDITEGDCVGDWDAETSEEVDGRRMADLLREVGSEPGFFQLDDEGNDIDGVEEDEDGLES